MPEQAFELHLPRWDADWEITGWRQSTKTGRVLPVKKRKVWDPLQANKKGNHWGPRASATRTVIETVAGLAMAEKVPRCQRLTVQLHWAPGDWRRADSDNLYPLTKACYDALARGRKDLPGLHLVPDDSDEYMAKEPPEIVRPPHPGGLWLTVVATW